MPRVKQHDATDCGAACLYSIARHHGKRLPLSRIRQLASTDRRGTTVLGLVEAASELGFRARGVRGPVQSLSAVPVPAVAHVLAEGGLLHFVVLCRVGSTYVRVMDPADGHMHSLALPEFTRRWTGVLVLLAPGEEFRPGSMEKSLPRRLWQLAWPHRRVMTQALAGAIAYTVLGLATAVYVQKVVDHALPDSNAYLLHVMGAAMLGIVLAQAVMGWTRNLLVLRTGQEIDAALILGYYKHLLALPQRFFDTMRVGEVLSRINDAVKIRAFVNDVALDLLVSVLVLVFSFAMMFTYSPVLALVMCGAIPGYVAIYYGANRLNRTTERRTMERAAELEAHLVESLGSIATIKRFGLERSAGWKAEAGLVRLLRPVYRSGRISIASGAATETLNRAATVALFWIGGLFVIGQRLTTGELMSFYALLGYLTGPTAALIGSNRTIQSALIAADRLFEVMDLELDDRPRLAELRRASVGDITFRGVAFRYGARRHVFNSLDMVIRHGSTTAIVGPSGCGKSTVAAILQGIYPIHVGQVRIGGLDLRDVTPASLRRRIGIVPQKVELFSGSILENLTLGARAPDLERLAEICDRLGMREMIDSMPGALHAQVGENGVELSGGQRQRIAIARALYRDPEVLILDEAASALDPLAEREVRDELCRMRSAGKTIVMIAHRLSGITWADTILVLSGGVVAEEGTHAELLAAGGLYRQLWTSQFPQEAAPGEAGPAGGSDPSRAVDPPPPVWLRSI